MINFKKSNEMSISFVNSSNQSEYLDEITYIDKPNIISINNNIIQLIHSNYKIILSFMSNNLCKEFYDNMIKDFSKSNETIDLGGMSDLGDMFGDMFGKINSEQEEQEKQEVSTNTTTKSDNYNSSINSNQSSL